MALRLMRLPAAFNCWHFEQRIDQNRKFRFTS